MFKDYGVGVGLRAEHYDAFLGQKPKKISWVEVITENYLPWKSNKDILRPQALLERVRETVPVALHGVSLSIGSADKINKNYLKAVKNLASRINPLWISDHLCWTGVGNENLHDLLPLPYTEDAIKHVVNNVKQVQDFLGRRILLENVSSYAEFKISEMREWDFISEIAKRADCGILLDINNVYVSSVNHSFDPLEYLRAIPQGRVGQYHLAGHTQKNGYLIDTHDAPVCDEVWSLFSWVNKNMGERSSMIERDSQIPPWEVLFQETEKILAIREEKSE